MIGAERHAGRSVSGGRIHSCGECKFIPPHQSLTRQLPPKGKPSLRRAYIANTTLNSEYTADRYVANNTSYFRSVALLCSAKEALQKGFPSGGKKTASSLSRKRLMRGDKSALTIGILLAERLCASDVRRLRIRHHNKSHPAYQSSAKPHHIKRSHLPPKPKTSPISPPFSKSETNLHF